MDMLFVDAPTELRDRVIGLWSLRGRPEGLYSGLPKPFVEIIVSLSGNHFWQRDETANPINYRQGWVTPVQSGPRFAQTNGPLHLIGARISIGAAATLFGPDVNRDDNAPIPLDSLLGQEAGDLREQLLEKGTEADRIGHLQEWLARRLSLHARLQLPTSDDLMQFGWRTDALANHMGLSARGLRKRFKTKFGIGPKFWLQLNRFDSVLNSEITSAGLADTAFSFGYTDQAHMTSDFKRFAGKPPSDYLKTRQIDEAPKDAPHFIPNSK